MRALLLLLLPGLLLLYEERALAAGSEPASSDRPGAQRAPAPPGDLFDQGLRAFRARRFAEAAALLERARLREASADLLLMLGIAYYRTGDLPRAVPVLRQAAASQDAETSATARLFLALIIEEQGGADSARAELARIEGALGPSARGILQGLAPRRIQGSVVLSTEYDGNVALTDLPTWRGDSPAYGDGDLLVVGSVSVRPFRSLGLAAGTSLSYRQQLQPKFQAYNLLLSNTWVGYSYFTETHRLRAGIGFNYALLGGASLFVDGEWRASYRARLYSQLGILVGYVGRYRSYPQADYAPFTGHTHTGQVELGWALSPQPISAAIGYQVIREQLAPGTAVDDYRATAHGPTARIMARPHARLELLFTGALIMRRFDVFLAGGVSREDVFLVGDLSATVQLKRWLDGFGGLTLIYNSSNDGAFTYAKPVAYLGASARFSAL